MNIKNFIKKQLNEALGVPDEILYWGKHFYEKVLEFIRKSKTFDDISYQHKIPGRFKIGDYSFDTIDFSFDFTPISMSGDENYRYLGMYFRPYAQTVAPPKNGKSYRVKSHNPTNQITIGINIGINPGVKKSYDSKEFYDFMYSIKNDAISHLTHEMAHSFDVSKKSDRPAGETIKYGSVNSALNERFNIGLLRKFFFLMYYTHNIENAVRVPELAAKIVEQGITQPEFKQFLKKSEAYYELESAKEMTYEKLLDSIAAQSDLVRGQLAKTHGYEVLQYSNDDIAELILSKLFELFKSNTTGLATSFLGVGGSQVEYLKKYLKKSKLTGSYEDFYRHEIKLMNRAAEKMMKKLAGLYAYIPLITQNNDDKTEIEADEQVDMILTMIKTGDIGNIELAFVIADSIDIDIESQIIEKYFKHELTKNNIPLTRDGLKNYFEKKKIGLI